MPGTVKVRALVLDVEKDLALGAELEIPGVVSFNQLLEAICQRYPRFSSQFCQDGGLAPYVRVFLNGRALAGQEVSVGPGSEVVFFPAIHGG